MDSGLEKEGPGNTMKKKTSVLKTLWIAGALSLVIGASCGCAAGRGADRETLRLSGIEKLDAGDYGGAIADLEEALSLGKGRVGEMELDILKYRAEAEYRIGDYSAAAHTYDILRQVDGEKPEYVRLHCMLSIQAGNTEEALEDYGNIYEDYKTAAEKGTKEGDSVTRDSLLNLLKDVGQALEEAGQTDAALELYSQAEADGLADSVVYNRKGLCYLNRGEYSAAGQAFEAGMKAADTEAAADLAFNHAVALEYQGNYEEALKAFEAYVAQYGSDEKAEHEIAFLRTR